MTRPTTIIVLDNDPAAPTTKPKPEVVYDVKLLGEVVVYVPVEEP